VSALAGAAAVVAIAVIVGVAVTRSDGGLRTPADPAKPTSGLPNTPDYHSLMVSPTDPRSLLLGTHYGLFRSVDGGRTWAADALGGKDAMNLVRSGGQTLWVAGHMVLTKSTDGGKTWSDARPRGLPGFDVHGFAIDPRNPRTLYAAVARKGLYRSTDGGNSFSVASTDVGPAVWALAVMPDGRILAGDLQKKGLMVSRDSGKTWALNLQAEIGGLAVNPADPDRVLATGPGVLLSTDGAGSWKKALDIPDGAGPVAWSKSNPKIAYVVGFDRRLYRSTDSGQTWSAVG
jgi:photosystem II stability/assembly factor-like uncharacterized protein